MDCLKYITRCALVNYKHRLQLSSCLRNNSRRMQSTQSQSIRIARLENELPQMDETADKSNLLHEDDPFGIKKMFTMTDLFHHRVHMGHKEGLRNPFMVPYLYGCRLGTDIIDLDKTVPLLQDALTFVAHIAHRGGIVLFISKNIHMMPLVEQTATECGEYSHCRHFFGGTFTNSTVQFGQVTCLPDVCIFLCTHDSVFEEHVAVTEAAKMNIPTVGITDTGSDPRLITYPVPGNDDTPCAIELYCNLFKQAILAGKNKRAQESKLMPEKT